MAAARCSVCSQLAVLPLLSGFESSQLRRRIRTGFNVFSRSLFFFFFFMCDTKRSKGMSLVTYSDAALWLWPCAKVDVRWGLAQVRAVTVTNQLCRTP